MWGGSAEPSSNISDLYKTTQFQPYRGPSFSTSHRLCHVSLYKNQTRTCDTCKFFRSYILRSDARVSTCRSLEMLRLWGFSWIVSMPHRNLGKGPSALRRGQNLLQKMGVLRGSLESTPLSKTERRFPRSLKGQGWIENFRILLSFPFFISIRQNFFKITQQSIYL